MIAGSAVLFVSAFTLPLRAVPVSAHSFPTRTRTSPIAAEKPWGGDLEAEAAAAVAAVQKAMQLCNALACEMQMVESAAQGKTMDACDTQTGVSFIKPGDSTPVTAGDFAIQGLVSSALRAQFPDDRFMGEEDAADLRADDDLCALALRLAGDFGGDTDKEAFLTAVDNGLEPPRGAGERVWVLDPIDGTKGFMTGQGYTIGLALVDAKGQALVGVMGVPPEEEAPPIMAAVRGHGLRWFTAEGSAPVEYKPVKPQWAGKSVSEQNPPWLISPQKSADVCLPFGADHKPSVVCCGAMIKYYQVAAGRYAGFIQYEEELKAWDHACGLICVDEAGGKATDSEGDAVLFDGRSFSVKGGIVCASQWASDDVRQRLLDAASGCFVPEDPVEQREEPKAKAANSDAFGSPPAGFEWGSLY